MNGRDLLEAMSFLDEELVAASDAPPRAIPWKRVLSLAACFCILLAGAFFLFRLNPANQATESATEAAMFSAANAEADAALPETACDVGEAPAAGNASEALCYTVRLEELTETGFRARALEESPDWEQGDSILIAYAEGFLPDALIPGTEYRIWVDSFDPQTHCATIFQIEPVS
ncbi:MAG: hypothetical protein ACI4PL_01735 [Faecousia sp.]